VRHFSHMKCLYSILGLFLFFQPCIAEESFRIWTSSNGRNLEAKLINQRGVNVKLVTPAGKVLTVRLSRLSKQDRQYVKDSVVRNSFTLPDPFPDGKKGAILIASMNGTVEVYDHLLDETKPAEVGKFITSPKTLVTGKDGNAIIIFTNGTSANLKPNSRLFFQKIWQQEFMAAPFKVSEIKEETSPCRIAMELKAGGVVVDVKKLRKGSSFMINSPVAACGIRGTQFGFSATSDNSSLSVLEGEVVVLDSQKNIREVSSRQRVIATKSGSSSVTPVDNLDLEMINQSINKMERISRGYSLSKLEQIIKSLNKKPPPSSVPKAQKALPEKAIAQKSIWKKQYDEWMKTPIPYGGIKALKAVKEAIENKTTILDLSISPYDTSISDLEALATLTNLKSLDLEGNEISDLTPLIGLIHLEHLNLESNKIIELKPIASLSRLKSLNIKNNKISDVSAFANLGNLRSLVLNCTMIEDLRPLVSLTNLTHLEAVDTDFLDVKIIANLQSLRSLDLQSTEITDIRALALLVNLEHLGISDVVLSDNDLKSITKLRNLSSISLDNTAILDISPFLKLRNLSKLSISNCELFDIEPITGLSNLQELSLTKTKISNYTPILSLPKLQFLHLSNITSGNIPRLIQLKTLKKLTISNSEIPKNQINALESALPNTQITWD
jgi:internalin A